MDKYQKYIIDKCKFYFFLPETDDRNSCFDGETITITQNEDITINRYNLFIVGDGVQTIYAITGGKKTAFESTTLPILKKTTLMTMKIGEQHGFLFTVDFSDRTEAVEMVFKDGIATNVEIPIKYVEANRQAYYAKQAKLKREEENKLVNARAACGNDLINVYFRPVSDQYSYTEAELYVPNETKKLTIGSVTKTEVLSWDFIKKIKVPQGDFFLSIGGLAYGTYAVVLKQFDDRGTLIYKTDYIKSTITGIQQSYILN